MAAAPLDRDQLRDLITSRKWYHTLELAPGVVTPGWFDTRAVVAQLPFPETLKGRRCLDVGTFDGFWAFEMERRGASEVVAVDALEPASWDWPANVPSESVAEFARRHDRGAGFEIARGALGSLVTRVDRNVYDLSPDELGRFDFVYLGSLLIHLRDPVRALDSVRRVCGDDALLLVVDNIDLPLSIALRRRPVAGLDGLGRPWWWKPNLAGLVRMVESAGFAVVERPRRLYMPPGADHPLPPISGSSLLSRTGREAAIIRWRGDPHAALLARPLGWGP